MLRQIFSNIPLVVKNLLIINGLFFLGKMSLGNVMDKLFALHPFQSPDFEPWQLITHMFMHANFIHLFFNMFAIWMFGRILESTWGDKRFLIYYIITGLGAMVLYSIVQQVQISVLEAKMTVEQIQQVSSQQGYECYKELSRLSELNTGKSFRFDFGTYGINNENMIDLLPLYYTSVLGASGALFGILLAFGMLFPSTRLRVFAAFLILISFEMIFSIPLPIFNIFIILLIISRIDAKLNYYIWYTIPIQAKYFVLAYGLLELFLSFMNTNDGIAHFAHLGGMLFGFLLLIYWKKKGDIYF